jgi:hypothetical protein
MTNVQVEVQEYAMVRLDHGVFSTLIYRDAPFPQSERPENQIVRTYEADAWDGRFEPATVTSTYEEAIEAMAIHHGDYVAVPTQVARRWFPGMRFASDPGVWEESA